MKYNYKYLKKIIKPTNVESLPESGSWHSIPVAAYLTGYPDSQMVRFMYLNGKIQGIRLPIGPILVNIKEIPVRNENS